MNIGRPGIFAGFCAMLLVTPAMAFDDSGMTRNEIRYENFTRCAALAYASDAIDDGIGDHFMELAYDLGEALEYGEDEVKSYVEAKAAAVLQYRETAGAAVAADYESKAANQCAAIGQDGSGGEVQFRF